MLDEPAQTGSHIRRRWTRLGLTARLALVGLLSSLAPFLVGMLIFVLMPDRVASRAVDSELQQAASLATARLQSARADLAFELASIDQAAMRRAVVAEDADSIERLLDADRSGRGRTIVELRPGGALTGEDGAVASSIRIAVAGEDIAVVARRPSLDEQIVRKVARDADVDLQLGDPGDAGYAAGARDGRDIAVLTVRKDARQIRTDFDVDRGVEVRASLDDSPFDLLVRARGDELRVALLLLLGAGLLSAVSVALIMNRMLRGVAATAQRMSGGDFDTRLPVVGVDAGARVAASLNELASELQDRIGTLEGTVERLDRTLASIDDGVCTWSPEGELLTWNESLNSLLDMESDVARSGASGPAFQALRAEFLPGRRRMLLPMGDGTRHLAVDLTVRRMRDGGTLQVVRDAAPALSIERARTNFLVTAAHELRTPLTSILGFAETLADEGLELTPDVRGMAIRQILADSKRLDGVVDMFFESSMLARDKVAVELAHVPVSAAVWQAVEQIDQARSVELQLDASLAVQADRDALVRILAGLVDNAYKYGAAPVRVSAEADHGRVRIQVSDGGRGIPLELQDAVFEPFFRLDPEMRVDVGGAGMGLYTARRLTEAMGGTITVGSPSAGGTVVTVDLPRWVAAQSSDDGSVEPVLSADGD